MNASKGSVPEILKALETAPNMYLVLSPDLHIITASDLYLNATETTREAIQGKHTFDAFPDNPGLPGADGVQNINASLQAVLKTKKPDYMRVQRYDVPDIHNPGKFIQRYWDPSHTPVFDEHGEIAYIIQLANNVTDKIQTERALVKSQQEQVQTSQQIKLLNDELLLTNVELRQTQKDLYLLNTQLEERVLKRTEELAASEYKIKESFIEQQALNTALSHTQQKLEEGEIALRLAIEAANFGTWFIHSGTRQFNTDARLKELFGYYPDEPLSIEQALAQITGEYRGFVAEKLENAIYNGGDYDVSYPVIGLHDNQLRWLRAIGNLKTDSSGAFSTFTGVVMDITEQYLGAKKIADAEENLRMATDSGELATWYLNEKSGKITASARFNELFGFAPDEEVPYAAAVNQVMPEYRQAVMDAVRDSFATGAKFNIEYPVTGHGDGKQRWVRCVGKYVADDKNGNYITGVMADITEQKMDEIRKNDFIGMVSHELKTPLTSLTAYLQMLQGRAKKSEDSFTLITLEKSVKQVKRMSTIINGFLNVSRLESGKIYIDKIRFDMAELMKDMEMETEPMYALHEIIFAPAEETFVFADRDKIGQVVSNLISNAVKYSNSGTKILVACTTINGCAQVSVNDKGMGIRAEEIPRLFERYYRVKNDNIAGFGIGLYLSAEIIERHQGSIWVESEPGKGSTFYFSLPVV